VDRLTLLDQSMLPQWLQPVLICPYSATTTAIAYGWSHEQALLNRIRIGIGAENVADVLGGPRICFFAPGTPGLALESKQDVF